MAFCRRLTPTPTIGTAYDWITAQGYQPDGLPREIWNGPDEKGMMEIAWPFIVAK